MRLKEKKIPDKQKRKGILHLILKEFIESDMDSARIVFEPGDKKTIKWKDRRRSLLGQLKHQIKKYKFKNVWCHMRNGRVYLVKIDTED